MCDELYFLIAVLFAVISALHHHPDPFITGALEKVSAASLLVCFPWRNYNNFQARNI